MVARGVPHASLKRRGYDETGEYLYEPWEMVIDIDEHNPGWGNTFKAVLDGVTLKLGRLSNFRTLLKLIQEKAD